MVGGATLTKLIGTSAWYAPGAASAMMVEAILNDQKKMVPCSCLPRRRIRPVGHLHRRSGDHRPQGHREDREDRPFERRGREVRSFGRRGPQDQQRAPRNQGDLIPRCERYGKADPESGGFLFPDEILRIRPDIPATLRRRHNRSPARPGTGFRAATRIRNSPQKPPPHAFRNGPQRLPATRGLPPKGQPFMPVAAVRTQKLNFAPTNQLRGSDGP